MTSATRKLKVQELVAAMPATLWRIPSGAISDAYMKGIINMPIGSRYMAIKYKKSAALPQLGLVNFDESSYIYIYKPPGRGPLRKST